MKFTIIMPTYNDHESITKTLDSIVSQSYKKWNLIIVDDGSTDNTKDTVKPFLKKYKNIEYIYQNNQDQLRAINNALEKIDGDYVYILHSDDLFASKDVLWKANNFLTEHPNYDAITADLINIDENDNITGKTVIPNYVQKDHILATQLLWLGRQFFIDFAFFKTSVFKTAVKTNYLIWNTPYWLCTEDECTMLDVKKVDFPFIKYRIFAGNYINNEIGQLNVINGELRTATRLMKYYDIPFYRIQYFIFRVFNKLKLVNIYRPIYFKKEQKNKGEVVEFIIKKRYKDNYQKYPFLNSIIAFYKKNNKRSIKIVLPKNFKSYEGCDMRGFNKQMLNGTLDPVYVDFMKEMKKGFNKIITDKKSYDEVLKLTKFMCVYPFVEIEIGR